LRFDEVEHHLHRHRGVYRGAALFQDIAAGLGGQRVVGHHHVAARGRHRLAGETGGDLRRPVFARRARVVDLASGRGLQAGLFGHQVFVIVAAASRKQGKRQ